MRAFTIFCSLLPILLELRIVIESRIRIKILEYIQERKKTRRTVLMNESKRLDDIEDEKEREE